MFRFFSTRRSLVRQLNVAEKTINDLKAMMKRQEGEIKTQVGLKVKSALKVRELKAELKRTKKDMQWHIDNKVDAAKAKERWEVKFNACAVERAEVKRQLELSENRCSGLEETSSHYMKKVEELDKEVAELHKHNKSLAMESFNHQNTIRNLQTTIATRNSQSDALQRQIPDPGVAKSRSGKNFTPYVAFPNDNLDDGSDDDIFYSTKRFKTDEEAWLFVNNLYLPASERVKSLKEWEELQNAKAEEVAEAFEKIGGERD